MPHRPHPLAALLPAVFIAAATLIASNSPARAQTVIIEEEEEAAPTFFEALQRAAFGSVGGFYAFGTSIQRRFVSGELGLDYEVDNVRMGGTNVGDMRFYLEGYVSYRFVELDQELRSGEMPSATRPRERSIKADEVFFDFNDAYFQYEPLPGLVFRGGRSTILWGQFDIFSAVNFNLPIQFQTKSIGFGKETYRVPQDNVSLSWFPLENVEIQGYYFFSTRFDDLYLEFFEDSLTSSVFVSGSGGGDPQVEERRVASQIEDNAQLALRLLYYPSWGTVGFTYYRGTSPFNFESFSSLVPDNSLGEPVYNVIARSDLPTADSFGFEIAYLLGNWTLKGEALYARGDRTLSAGARRDAEFDDGGARGVAQRAFYEWIVDNNDGQLYVDEDVLLLEVGADGEVGGWNFNLSLLFFEAFQDSQGKEGVRLHEAAFDEDESFFPLFPVLNITYAFDERRRHKLGLAGGLLGPYAGATVYFTSDVKEDFRWVASVEYLQSISDNLLSDSNDEDQRYKLADFSAGGRIGFIYDF